jgi:hypothetical protein
VLHHILFPICFRFTCLWTAVFVPLSIPLIVSQPLGSPLSRRVNRTSVTRQSLRLPFLVRALSRFLSTSHFRYFLHFLFLASVANRLFVLAGSALRGRCATPFSLCSTAFANSIPLPPPVSPLPMFCHLFICLLLVFRFSRPLIKYFNHYYSIFISLLSLLLYTASASQHFSLSLLLVTSSSSSLLLGL